MCTTHDVKHCYEKLVVTRFGWILNETDFFFETNFLRTSWDSDGQSMQYTHIFGPTDRVKLKISILEGSRVRRRRFRMLTCTTVENRQTDYANEHSTTIRSYGAHCTVSNVFLNKTDVPVFQSSFSTTFLCNVAKLHGWLAFSAFQRYFVLD